MILFDTDMCIEILRGNTGIVEKRRRYADDIGVSFMTAAELYYGVFKSTNPTKNRHLVEQLLMTFTVIESDSGIEKRFGDLKAKQDRRGLTVADADLLIAATALEHCLFLVTGNVRHFEMIEELTIQNWRESHKE